MRQIDLNDYLSKDNLWACRLLGFEKFQQERDTQLIEHEYNCKFYGKRLSDFGNDLNALRKRVNHGSDKEIVISIKDQLLALQENLFLKIKRSYMLGILQEYCGDSSICELGAGFGQNFIWLNQQIHQEIYGGEFSSNGVKLGRLLGFDIQHFNFYESATYEFIRPQSTVFTAHAVEQVPDAGVIIDNLKQNKDKINCVIHFEPLYRNDRNNLIGLFRNKYALINNYNSNLLKLLHSDSDIEILLTKPDVYGRNPLNPTSIIIWRFR